MFPQPRNNICIHGMPTHHSIYTRHANASSQNSERFKYTVKYELFCVLVLVARLLTPDQCVEVVASPSTVVDHLPQKLERGLRPVGFHLRHIQVVHEDNRRLAHGGAVHAYDPDQRVRGKKVTDVIIGIFI